MTGLSHSVQNAGTIICNSQRNTQLKPTEYTYVFQRVLILREVYSLTSADHVNR